MGWHFGCKDVHVTRMHTANVEWADTNNAFVALQLSSDQSQLVADVPSAVSG